MNRKHRAEAYTTLFLRYKSIFLHYWQNRHLLGNRMLAEHEAEFLPAALALQEKPISPAARLLAMVLIALVIAVVAWATVGKIDIIVNGTGKVIPSGYTKTIASVDVASVRALYVEEGQQVKEGDVLVELDSSTPDADRDKAIGDRGVAQLQVLRAKALISAIDGGSLPQLPRLESISPDKWKAAQSHLDGQYRDFITKLKRVESSIAHYREALALATQRAADYKSLLKDHDVSEHAWLEKEQARVDLEGQLTDARNLHNALIAETKRTAYDQLNEGSKSAAEFEQDALRSDARSKLLKLIAPVDGTVQQLDVHTVGGVVSAAKALMQIVPKVSTVEVEAFLENKDVGFVHEGQSVEVKVDAYEYTKYGTVSGRVTHVSRDAIADEKKGLIYSTKIALDKSTIDVDAKDMPLSAGMSVNVEIKTGERRIIEYVLSPLVRHQRESLHER